MGIDPRLLEKLVCPKCRGPISATEDQLGLDCKACSLRYPVEKFGDTYVPDMIIEHAMELGNEDDPRST